MLCACCMRIFKLEDPFARGIEHIPHHANTQSFVSSATAGCPICRAVLSELDEPQKFLSDPNVISSTKCSFQNFVNADSNVRSYYVKFGWSSPGVPRRYRGLLVEPYHTIRPHLPREPLKTGRGWSGQTLQMVKTWMRTCLEQHPKCQALHAWRTSGPMFQPKRLIDVGAAGETMWRLVVREGNTIFPTTYATLSHRWNSNQQFRLVSEDVQAYTDGQSLDILPQVFRDVIRVVKSLGIQYLWADCLCIIQDSLLDWETESLEMCKIYTNATCNISITGFEDNSTGFLGKTCNYVPLPSRVQPSWARHIDEGWCVVDPFFWWAQITKAPLTKRGWVFQERFLAPRVLHFGPEQLLWECASLDACEAFPSGIPAIVESPRHTGFKRLDFLFEKYTREGLLPKKGQLLSITQEDLLNHWCSIVQAYTRTSLTKPNDKLIALAGVAQLMSRSDSPTTTENSRMYLAGLFRQHLLLMLEWHSDGNMPPRPEPPGIRPPQYRAPSWSWASVDVRVFYDYLPRRINDGRIWNRKPSWQLFLERLNQTTPNSRSTPQWLAPSRCVNWKPLVFDMKPSITTIGESLFGQISNGNIELKGMLIMVRDIISTSSRNPHLRPILVHLDAPTNSEPSKLDTLLLPLRCIQLSSSHNNDPIYWVTGLLLEPVDSDESTYQRCGMLSILSADGIREAGIKVTETPFAVKYSPQVKLETIHLV
ncbi:heterokaryon incompatibility protein-domain-containing protein [Nemania diffusa]|nr:heterokaryon incompatibility protein-domain-containing protein [Nemania diffusa]